MSKPSTSSTEPEVRRPSRGSNGWLVWMAGVWMVFFVLLNSDSICAQCTGTRARAAAGLRMLDNDVPMP